MGLRCWLFGHSPMKDFVHFRDLDVSGHGFRCKRCRKPLHYMGMQPRQSKENNDE